MIILLVKWERNLGKVKSTPTFQYVSAHADMWQQQVAAEFWTPKTHYLRMHAKWKLFITSWRSSLSKLSQKYWIFREKTEFKVAVKFQLHFSIYCFEASHFHNSFVIVPWVQLRGGVLHWILAVLRRLWWSRGHRNKGGTSPSPLGFTRDTPSKVLVCFLSFVCVLECFCLHD